jgi:AcrR family transcriptional regulator
MAGDARPQRGTRPANRRDLIVAAAAELFRTRGYEHVSMSDIADAVAIGPSALYRHVSGKQQLLEEAVSHGLAIAEEAVAATDAAQPEASLQALVRVTIEQRHLATLWEHESSHLPTDQQASVRAQIRRIAGRLSALSQAMRPELSDHDADLVSWAMLAVLISPSFYRAKVTPSKQVVMLTTMAKAVVYSPIPASYRPGKNRPTHGLMPYSRREALLQRSIHLFADRRYASVSIDDIAGAIGVAVPSVYKHFTSKAEILVTAFNRADAYLLLDMSDTLASSASPEAALRGLIKSYVNFALRHPDLTGILITESRNLPEPHRDKIRDAQRAYVEQWARLRADANPRLNPAEARVQVQAVLSVANYIARNPHLYTAHDIAPSVAAICESILGLTADE